MTLFARNAALGAALGLLGWLLFVPAPVHARAPTYAEALGQALSAMETGKHAQAAGPLKAALLLDRNEPSGLLALGALYLHTGSPARAAAEFKRALALTPGDALAGFGAALAALTGGKRDAGMFDALPAGEVPAAPVVAAYARLLAGDAAGARSRLGTVAADETDPLRLEVAAFAALRGGDPVLGEALLRALLARPKMNRLAEDHALVLPFETHTPAEAGAPPLPSAIGFPAPNGGTLSGRVTLAPGALPAGAAYVSYALEGGGFTATTNFAPFTLDWNTARLPNGLHTLCVTAFDADARRLRETRRTLHLNNQGAPRSQRLSPPQALEMRGRLLALLTPRASRKAAHFALAERAAARGDGPASRTHIEAVVAIDPHFRNARLSLRRHNLLVEGAQSGVWRGGTREKVIALTFDDGPNPHPRRTPALLDALAAEGAKATFFVVGVRVEQAPGLVRRMADEGHEVANHSYSHQNLALLSPASVERELCRTSVLIREATGKRPRFFRPPGGNFNGTVSGAAEALGMAGAYWTVDAHKQEEAASPGALTRYVLAKAKPGAILLLHNAPDVTVAAVPAIVRGLRARGYTLVTMSELARRGKSVAASR